jgi:hypothetical protein
LAAVAVAKAPDRAARLVGAAEGLRAAIGAPRPHAECAEHERHVATACAALGEAAFAAAWATGRTMPLERMIPEALRAEKPL